jgi:hypothetical protein
MRNDNSQGGFTVMETLIATGALSLSMIVLSLSLHSSAGAVEKAKDRALFAVKLLRADSLIRERIGRVAAPYWEKVVPETGESSVTIPWYRGEREGSVRLLALEGTLVLETEDRQKKESILLMSGLDGTEFSVLRNQGDVPVGIGVAYFRGQHSYHTLSAFASLPLMGAPIGGLPSIGGRP